MKEKTFNRLKKIGKFIGMAAILGIADSVGGSASFSVGNKGPEISYEGRNRIVTDMHKNNDVRNAVDDIVAAVQNMDNDYFKQIAAGKIVKMVSSSNNRNLKCYAASGISKIADSIQNSYFKSNVVDMATRLLA